jgi:capsular polysaccharide biosynthesis protein
MIRLIVRRLLESYFRHRFLWLAPLVVMIGFAGAQFVMATPASISLAAVYVNKESLLASLTSLREDGFSWVTPAQATVDEFKELLQTDAFMRSVVQLTDLEEQMGRGPKTVAETLVEARDAVWVQTLGKNLIMVGAAHKRPEVAQQLAAATIEVYIRWKINSKREESLAALKFFDDLLTTYEAELEAARDELQSYVETHPAPVRGDRPESEAIEIKRLQDAVDLAATRYAKALDNQESARLAIAMAESEIRRTYVILDAPRLPLSPQQSKKEMVITGVIFAVVGVILSVTGVVGSALLDRTVRFPEDVPLLLELPLLATLPDTTTQKKRRRRDKGEM